MSSNLILTRSFRFFQVMKCICENIYILIVFEFKIFHLCFDFLLSLLKHCMRFFIFRLLFFGVSVCLFFLNLVANSHSSQTFLFGRRFLSIGYWFALFLSISFGFPLALSFLFPVYLSLTPSISDHSPNHM